MDDHQHVFLHVPIGTILKVVFVLTLCVAAFLLRELVLAVLAAVVVASGIEPVAKWFIARRIPRLPAVIFIYAILALVLFSTIYFLVIPLVRESTSFLSNLPGYLDTAGQATSSSPFLPGLPNQFSLHSAVLQLNDLLTNLTSGVFGSISFVFGGIVSFILVIVLSFYLSVQEDGVGKFLKTITPFKQRTYIAGLWKRSQEKIGLWMQGQLLLVVIVAVLVYLGLALLGVNHAILLAALAGMFELIPLFGPILAAVPAVAIAYTTGGVSLALFVVGLYLIIQQFENQLIYPLVVKKVVGVSPIISIIAIIAGVQLAGFMGLILSVPVAAVLMEFFKDIEKSSIHEGE